MIQHVDGERHTRGLTHDALSANSCMELFSTSTVRGEPLGLISSVREFKSGFVAVVIQISKVNSIRFSLDVSRMTSGFSRPVIRSWVFRKRCPSPVIEVTQCSSMPRPVDKICVEASQRGVDVISVPFDVTKLVSKLGQHS